MRHTTLAQWLAWQEALHPRSIDLGLERVRTVAGRLGLLQPRCPVITVGGTNGKGSCVALLESILAAGGYRVGAFTSPHLIHYNERIRIAGRPAGDEEIVTAFGRIDAARADISLTFFEFNTLAALALFHDAALDVQVLEVGLGGRLDAVNVIDADAALLTGIAFDHCGWLGDTLEQIGREKAGIFRRGRPAVLGASHMPQSVLDAATVVGATVIHADSRLLQGLPPPALGGQRQFDNAAAVLTVLQALRERLPLTAEQIARGLSTVKLPGRFQIAGGQIEMERPEWIFDVAHNPDAAAALADNLAARPCAGRTIAVVGILEDKDVAAVIAPLLPLVQDWIATTLPGVRGLSAQQMIARLAGAGIASAGWSQCATVAEACEQAAGVARPADRIVVFGSFCTVGPALQWRGMLADQRP